MQILDLVKRACILPQNSCKTSKTGGMNSPQIAEMQTTQMSQLASSGKTQWYREIQARRYRIGTT